MDLKKRIKKNDDFKRIIQLKNIIKLNSVNIYFNKNTKETKYGISVSKKLGNAVIRNKSKRRIKGILKDIPIKSNVEFILIVKQKILEMTYNELKDELFNSLQNL